MRDASHRDAVVRKYMAVVLGVLPDLELCRVLEPWAQALEHELRGELRGRAGVAVRERDVGGLACHGRKVNAHQLGGHRVEAGLYAFAQR